MKLTATVKLLPTPEQAALLKQVLETANAACDYISAVAWQHRKFSRNAVHHLTYYPARERFGLAAQVVALCIGKVVHSYQTDKESLHVFRPHGGIAFDDRILGWRVPDQMVSIWTSAGRQTIPFAAGERQLAFLKYQKGESDLLYRKGMFLLTATCDVPDEPPEDIIDFLGVDLGVKNIAFDSDGSRYSARYVLNVRHRHRRLRRKLQHKGTRSARRKLQRLSGREYRFANDVNHCISKQLIKAAKGTQRGIGLEDLTGIRQRVTVSRRKRSELHSWSFADLGEKIAYKAQYARVLCAYVDPRNTSRQCSQCAHVDKASRRSQSEFLCTACGCASHADYNAARNIRRKANEAWAGRQGFPLKPKVSMGALQSANRSAREGSYKLPASAGSS
jgi:IS605 OrfB family transposase